MEEGLYLQGAAILIEVYRDPRRDGSGYLDAGPNSGPPTGWRSAISRVAMLRAIIEEQIGMLSLSE